MSHKRHRTQPQVGAPNHGAFIPSFPSSVGAFGPTELITNKVKHINDLDPSLHVAPLPIQYVRGGPRLTPFIIITPSRPLTPQIIIPKIPRGATKICGEINSVRLFTLTGLFNDQNLTKKASHSHIHPGRSPLTTQL